MATAAGPSVEVPVGAGWLAHHVNRFVAYGGTRLASNPLF
jgi:hypothetical protein